MANGYWDWDPTTFLNNGSVDSRVNWQENQAPSTVNGSARAEMGIDAQYRLDQGFPTAGGSADALTLTPLNVITSYANYMVYTFRAAAANTGAATINVNSAGVKAIRKIGGGTDVALSAGDLAVGNRYQVVYDASANSAAGAFILTGPPAQASVSAASNAEVIAGTVTNKYVSPATAYYSPGTLYGLTLSNNVTDATNDIDIAIGAARSQDATTNMDLLSGLTKRLDATWVVGTNQGFLASGAALTNTTYHIFLIKRPDTGVVDVAADTSVTGANIAANTNAAYTQIRRIGSIIRTGGAIRAFYQRGDDFVWAIPAQDINTSNPGTAAQTITLTVPSGIISTADISSESSNTGSNHYIFFSPLAIADQAASASASQFSMSGTVRIGIGKTATLTNTSSQVRARWSASAAGDIWVVNTNGYNDPRGRI